MCVSYMNCILTSGRSPSDIGQATRAGQIMPWSQKHSLHRITQDYKILPLLTGFNQLSLPPKITPLRPFTAASFRIKSRSADYTHLAFKHLQFLLACIRARFGQPLIYNRVKICTILYRRLAADSVKENAGRQEHNPVMVRRA